MCPRGARWGSTRRGCFARSEAQAAFDPGRTVPQPHGRLALPCRYPRFSPASRGRRIDKFPTMHDLKFALRAFGRTPGASSLVVITLAVAIATATIVASTIDMVWRFIPVVRTDRLVFVASTDPRPEKSQAGMADGLARTGVSIPDLVDWSERAATVEAVRRLHVRERGAYGARRTHAHIHGSCRRAISWRSGASRRRWGARSLPTKPCQAASGSSL